MKKLSSIILFLMLILAVSGMSIAAPHEKLKSSPTPIEAKEVNNLLLRLNEINALDKSELNSSEKKALRKEVKSIKKALNSGGVYISVGAIIIIILLLILLL